MATVGVWPDVHVAVQTSFGEGTFSMLVSVSAQLTDPPGTVDWVQTVQWKIYNHHYNELILFLVYQKVIFAQYIWIVGRFFVKVLSY